MGKGTSIVHLADNHGAPIECDRAHRQFRRNRTKIRTLYSILGAVIQAHTRLAIRKVDREKNELTNRLTWP